MVETAMFEMRDGIAVFRPSGHASLEQAIDLVKSAIGSARERGVRKLLILASGLEGFESPGIGARHYMARLWAGISAGMLHIAVVPKADMIDPEKFGVLVARNFGASVDVFSAEADAIEWLRSKR
ncbi:MAG TPA: hypothetical protein VLB69_06855 [Rudaea sp.]|nr:hypothetical protein [Rudaea sp.]